MQYNLKKAKWFVTRFENNNLDSDLNIPLFSFRSIIKCTQISFLCAFCFNFDLSNVPRYPFYPHPWLAYLSVLGFTGRVGMAYINSSRCCPASKLGSPDKLYPCVPVDASTLFRLRDDQDTISDSFVIFSVDILRPFQNWTKFREKQTTSR